MRTTLNIDDEALASAMKTSPGKTKTDVINDALRDYARRQRLQILTSGVLPVQRWPSPKSE